MLRTAMEVGVVERVGAKRGMEVGVVQRVGARSRGNMRSPKLVLAGTALTASRRRRATPAPFPDHPIVRLFVTRANRHHR